MHRILAATFAAALSWTGLASAQVPDVDIPFEQFELENGLTVVVHEDRKAPIVAVSIWYGVGSGAEPAGRTGFAHLFEHLMFNGSENYNDDYFGPFEDVGATGLNGTTWFDRTNYFPDRADAGPGHGAVDGIRPHDAPPRCHRPGTPR